MQIIWEMHIKSLKKISKVKQSSYYSAQKSELYVIVMVLLGFSEPLEQFLKSRIALHIEITKRILDDSHLQQIQCK